MNFLAKPSLSKEPHSAWVLSVLYETAALKTLCTADSVRAPVRSFQTACLELRLEVLEAWVLLQRRLVARGEVLVLLRIRGRPCVRR